MFILSLENLKQHSVQTITRPKCLVPCSMLYWWVFLVLSTSLMKMLHIDGGKWSASLLGNSSWSWMLAHSWVSPNFLDLLKVMFINLSWSTTYEGLDGLNSFLMSENNQKERFWPWLEETNNYCKKNSPVIALHGSVTLKSVSFGGPFQKWRWYFPGEEHAHLHKVVTNWKGDHCSDVERLGWSCHLADLNITEHLWCVFKPQVSNCSPLPSFLKEPKRFCLRNDLTVQSVLAAEGWLTQCCMIPLWFNLVFSLFWPTPIASLLSVYCCSDLFQKSNCSRESTD